MVNNEHIFKDLFATRKSKRNLSVFYVFAVALLIYQGSVFLVIKADDISSKNLLQDYQIDFYEFSETFDDSRVVNDGDREIIQFSPQDSLFEEYNGLGMIYLSISYTESSGEFLDQCDTISVDLIPNNVNADWNNENNILTGTSDDCSGISLQLMVFPEYDGQGYTAYGNSEIYWESLWSNSDYGNGAFELGIEVNVNQADPVLPTAQDDDEEVFITWEAVFFGVSVE